MKNYVIVGGGIASVGVIEGIRTLDTEGIITLISAEDTPVYCRPLISYYLEGKTDFEKMKYRPDSFYPENKCQLTYGVADKIDCENKFVYIGEKRLPYSELCIATGATPVSIDVPGKESIGTVYHFMTEADATALKEVLTPEKRVLICGAGLIGLKCAEGIKNLCGSVTVIDLANRVLSSILDVDTAKLIEDKLTENGISVVLNDKITAFKDGVAVTANGQEIPFDVYIEAIGVRPNVALVKGIADTNRGILTDKRMATSAPYIYAAGDCAEGYDSSTGKNGVLALLPNAYMQGFAAGVNMAGGDKVYDDAIPMNAIGFFGLHALSAGRYDGELFETHVGNTVKRLYFKDDRLIGFMIVGDDVQGSGIYTDLIRRKLPLSAEAIEVLKVSPSLSVFDKEARKTILGGNA